MSMIKYIILEIIKLNGEIEGRIVYLCNINNTYCIYQQNKKNGQILC